MWLSTAVTRLVTVFSIAPSRGADVASDLLGTDARKVVISDRLKSYGWIKRRQLCWALQPTSKGLQRSKTPFILTSYEPSAA
jgi:hypothetical protein